MVTDFQERRGGCAMRWSRLRLGCISPRRRMRRTRHLGSRGVLSARTASRPDMKAYFTSRGACMGQVAGEVVTAATMASISQMAARNGK